MCPKFCVKQTLSIDMLKVHFGRFKVLTLGVAEHDRLSCSGRLAVVKLAARQAKRAGPDLEAGPEVSPSSAMKLWKPN